MGSSFFEKEKKGRENKLNILVQHATGSQTLLKNIPPKGYSWSIYWTSQTPESPGNLSRNPAWVISSLKFQTKVVWIWAPKFEILSAPFLSFENPEPSKLSQSTVAFPVGNPWNWFSLQPVAWKVPTEWGSVQDSWSTTNPLFSHSQIGNVYFKSMDEWKKTEH